ncbi:MAG: putative transglycosylase [Gemmatimonadetes bacterium]|nr:putative transglycosylase [Gemmatimonadota bacterium]
MRHLVPILGTIVLAATATGPSPVAAQVADRGTLPQPPRTAARDTGTVAASDSGRLLVRQAGAPSGLSSRDLARRAVDVFGDSLAVTPPAVDEEPSWDMDVRSYETQARVAHYVTMFTGRSRAAITNRLERGTRYEPMIRAKFRAGGLPEDMYYLALVESGFDPNAYSRAAAVGMWQFMTSTGRGMGMRIDWWVDERRDPVRSTTAAVRFIRGLRDQFGSLYLAAAAYNGGPGRVARGLAKYSDDLENTRQADDAFFVLAEKDYLHDETREYVPQLIAAALVAKEPIRYGMELRPMEPFAYDSVRVGGGTPLAAVAKAAGTTTAAIRDLNPHFLRGMLPPGERMQVRVPVGAAAGFAASLAALTKAERIGAKRVVTKKGETVDRVAEANGISSATLERFNPKLRRLKPSGRLVPGQSLLVPTPAVAAAATHVPDPSVERYGSSAKGRLRTYTVRRGETLGAIARRFGTSPDRIMRMNGMRKPVIFAGQDLVVAGGKAVAAKSPARKSGRKGAAAGARAARKGDTAARTRQSGAGSKAGARKKVSKSTPKKRTSSAA